MARSGSISAMSSMQRNAPLLSAFAPYFSQSRIRTCLAKARCSSKVDGRTGLPGRGRLAGLQQRDGQVIGVAVEPGARESVSLLADEDVPGSREHPLEAEPALCVGGGRDRLGAVAAVEDGRAGDGPAIGADDPAGEVAGRVDQHELADIVRLPGLAGQSRRLGLVVPPRLDHDVISSDPARGRGRRTSHSRRWCTSPARSGLRASVDRSRWGASDSTRA